MIFSWCLLNLPSNTLHWKFALAMDSRVINYANVILFLTDSKYLLTNSILFLVHSVDREIRTFCSVNRFVIVTKMKAKGSMCSRDYNLWNSVIKHVNFCTDEYDLPVVFTLPFSFSGQMCTSNQMSLLRKETSKTKK